MKEFNLLDVVGTFVAQGILGYQTILRGEDLIKTILVFV